MLRKNCSKILNDYLSKVCTLRVFPFISVCLSYFLGFFVRFVSMTRLIPAWKCFGVVVSFGIHILRNEKFATTHKYRPIFLSCVWECIKIGRKWKFYLFNKERTRTTIIIKKCTVRKIATKKKEWKNFFDVQIVFARVSFLF